MKTEELHSTSADVRPDEYAVHETERERHAPYVVSADIERLLTDWAASRGFHMPEPRAVAEHRLTFIRKLEEIFPVVEFVTEYEMQSSIDTAVGRVDLTHISLDSAYFDSDPRLDVGRHVDIEGTSLGISHRPGAKPLNEQYDAVATELEARGIREVALVDDVLFSGGLIKQVRKALAAYDIRVKAVCAGIAIGGGMEEMEKLKIDVESDLKYPEVIDEVCERDFYPGVPYCGKTVLGEPNMGLPYLRPHGDPVEWAAIPEDRAAEFSHFCLHHTADLYDLIEDETGRPVTCHDVDRMIPGQERNGMRYSRLLRNLADEV